jgi:hypothetical protein
VTTATRPASSREVFFVTMPMLQPQKTPHAYVTGPHKKSPAPFWTPGQRR